MCGILWMVKIYNVSDWYQSRLRHVLSESTKSDRVVWDEMSEREKAHIGTYSFMVFLVWKVLGTPC